jgi:LPS-assembly protein
MINKIYFFLILIIFTFSMEQKINSAEQFNFDVTEIEILENGNLFKGLKRGTISTNDGIIINANQFEYNKILNKLDATGNVEIIDTNKDYKIYSESITYFKDDEIISSTEKSKALVQELIITGDIFNYIKRENIFNVKKNVKIIDTTNDVVIFSEDITYNKDQEKVFSKGNTSSIIQSKYDFSSSDVVFLRNNMILSSSKKTEIKDDKNSHYNLSKFNYEINKKKLKGENVIVTTNYNLPKSDRHYFKSGIFNFESKEFLAKDTKILLHSDLFGVSENNPRIIGISSSSSNNITTIKKGVFTSCGKNADSCPPWSISAKKIQHDKNKKQLIYDNAILRVYDFPVLYFPKFFHPDPSVDRQSGFLRPQINSSNVLGDSIYVPYFQVISDNKDLTFKPTFFDSTMQIFQNEYRQENKNSSFIADFSLTRGYQSSLSNKTNSISHLFAKFNSDLGLNSFIKSDLFMSVQKVSNDTYLKVFDTNLSESEIMPSDPNNLTSELKISLDHEKYDLTAGFKSFENLSLSQNDRYQYILPYYNYNKNIDLNFIDGQINFSSAGSNDLNNTNKLKTRVINDFEYRSNEIISNKGFVSKFNIYLKNLGTLGKNDDSYKSSPQIELMNIYEITSEFPLNKITNNFNNTITPKISFRLNPSDMKNYSSESRNVTVDNIFNINRLSLTDSYEKGRSITVGVDYKKENLKNINKYFEFKLASAFRDKEENFIPLSSSLNKKNSSLFGSVSSVLSENLLIDYDFRIDNNYKKFEYNSINTTFNFNNLETTFNFVEENGDTGNENFLENTTSYNFDDNNNFSFKTRRNRKLNLTEFYDLVYEYKNDCLIAGIKYNKTYYSDRDLKPKENLFFSITLFPLTKYEHSLDRETADRIKDQIETF